MATTKTPAAKIETICEERYGVNALTADAIVIEWAAEHMAKTTGYEAAARAWRRINSRRERMGKYTTIPQWGSKMFAAFLATN